MKKNSCLHCFYRPTCMQFRSGFSRSAWMWRYLSMSGHAVMKYWGIIISRWISRSIDHAAISSTRENGDGICYGDHVWPGIGGGRFLSYYGGDFWSVFRMRYSCIQRKKISSRVASAEMAGFRILRVRLGSSTVLDFICSRVLVITFLPSDSWSSPMADNGFAAWWRFQLYQFRPAIIAYIYHYLVQFKIICLRS